MGDCKNQGALIQTQNGLGSYLNDAHKQDPHVIETNKSSSCRCFVFQLGELEVFQRTFQEFPDEREDPTSEAANYT